MAIIRIFEYIRVTLLTTNSVIRKAVIEKAHKTTLLMGNIVQYQQNEFIKHNKIYFIWHPMRNHNQDSILLIYLRKALGVVQALRQCIWVGEGVSKPKC